MWRRSNANSLKRPHSPPLNDAGLEDEEGESSSPTETTLGQGGNNTEGISSSPVISSVPDFTAVIAGVPSYSLEQRQELLKALQETDTETYVLPNKYFFEVTSESLPIDEEVKKIEEDTERKTKRWISWERTIKSSTRNINRTEQILGYPQASSEVKKFELEHAKAQNSMITEILRESEKDGEKIESIEKHIKSQHDAVKLAEGERQSIAEKKKALEEETKEHMEAYKSLRESSFANYKKNYSSQWKK